MNNLEAPPKTIEEVGIHLFYLTRSVSDLDSSVKEQSKHYAPTSVTDDHEKRIGKLETKNVIKDTLLWVGLVASAIINIVLVYQQFGGGK
jgi:hypothetical protein